MWVMMTQYTLPMANLHTKRHGASAKLGMPRRRSASAHGASAVERIPLTMRRQFYSRQI